MRHPRHSTWARAVTETLGRAVTLTALLASIALAAEASDLRITVEYIPDAEFDFGRGFDATASEVRASCVEYAKLNEVGTTSASQVDSTLETIEDSSSLDRALGVSAAAKFSYGIFSGSAATNYSQNHSVNSFSQTYVARSSVKGATKSVDSPRLKGEYAEMQFADYPRFRSVCGDYYVDGFTTGGEYLGIVTISTQSREDKQSVDVGMTAAFNAVTTSGEVSADVRNSVSSLASHHRMKVAEIRRGGAGEPIAISATTMLENFRNFSKSVEGQSAFYHVILRKYTDLPNYPKSFQSTDPIFESAIQTIENLANLSHDWTSVLNDINELKNHREEYVGASDLPLETWEGEVRNTLGTLRQAFLGCAADYRNCAVPQLDHPLRYYTDNYPRSTWVRIPKDSDLAAQDIAVGSKDFGWALFSTTNASPGNPTGGFAPKRLGSGNSWTGETGGLVTLAIGGDGTVWGVNDQGVPFRWGGSAWAGLEGRLQRVAVGSANRVWGVNAAGEVYEWSGSGWTKIDVGVLVAQVAIGADGTLAIRSRDDDVVIGPSLDQMKLLVNDRKVVDVSVGSRDHVYFIDDDGDLYRWGGDTNKLIGPMGKFTRVSAASDGTVWAMNGQGEIFKLGSL